MGHTMIGIENFVDCMPQKTTIRWSCSNTTRIELRLTRFIKNQTAIAIALLIQAESEPPIRVFCDSITRWWHATREAGFCQLPLWLPRFPLTSSASLSSISHIHPMSFQWADIPLFIACRLPLLPRSSPGQIPPRIFPGRSCASALDEPCGKRPAATLLGPC